MLMVKDMRCYLDGTGGARVDTTPSQASILPTVAKLTEMSLSISGIALPSNLPQNW